MELKATVLCENFIMSNLGAIAEHGWAVHLETHHGNFLFDTGQGKGLLNNARIFKVDLSRIQGILISYHHVDHTGGLLDAVSTAAGTVPVYAHPDLFKRETYITRKGKRFQIGLPFVRELLESKGAEFRLNRDWVEIAPRMYLTGEVPRKTPYEKVEEVIQTKNEKGEFVPDLIVDDLSLVMDTEKGLFIVLGCAHAGIINIMNYAIEKTGKSHIHAVIGGTHLWPVSEEQREKSIEALKDFDMDRIGVSHCTGLKPAMQLAQEFGDRFFFCNVGDVVEV
jgi:7,8-dihydropterin-6-yl-methyl-4-(beta-D-ribofuranosyl)aminobenzene 5'-phosphate synthase